MQDAVVKTKGQGLENQGKEVSIKDLLDSGVQFGHQTHRWNPKMRSFIFEARNGIHIIDLAKTRKQLQNALDLIGEIVKGNGSVLFVGTKKQAKDVVRRCAESAGEFYVCERWLGGMLTNHKTIMQSMKKLDAVEKRISQEGDFLTKIELSKLNKRQEKLDTIYSGVRSMKKLPRLLVIVDTGKEHIAVAEANKLGIPVIGLVDTNCDPDPVKLVVPCNDDAQKSIKVILEAMTSLIISKKNAKKMSLGKESTETEALKMEKSGAVKADGLAQDKELAEKGEE